MSFLLRLEEVCATAVERAFARTFASDLEPAQIARKLVSTMEANMRHEGGEATAPHRYAVRVNPRDFARLTAQRAYLERQWGLLLEDMARGVNMTIAAPFEVALREDAGVVRGAVAIDVLERAAPNAPRRPVEPVRPQSFALHVRKGMPLDARYPVAGEVTIGRGDGNVVVLTDARVSRRHARITVRDGRPVLEDLGSSNGTFVNGEQVVERVLSAADLITIGDTQLALETA